MAAPEEGVAEGSSGALEAVVAEAPHPAASERRSEV
jgi:hypothetical protein